MDNFIIEKLDQARRELLDLSMRNRLLSTPRSSSRLGRLEIVGELSEEVFRHLVREKKAMSFLPRPGPVGSEDEELTDESSIHLVQPEDDEVDETGVAVRHTDDRLQTRLTSEGLQKKLLKLYYDARTYEEEQGVNILYLALGFLKWYEADTSDRERYGPLVLVPVTLARLSATSRFRIQWTEDEITTNLSLQEKLRLEFGIKLPEVPDVEDLWPNEYYNAVAEAVSARPRWQVLPNDIVLWFFSFSKFLMYRDLQPENWPAERALEKHALIQALLRGGFRNEPPICGDDENINIDGILQPLDMVHVMDADSSQTIAIEEVKRGRNLVIQGPPGTGKSQTIANLIATAVKNGKKVLFVAEKMAALEVVKRRLDNIGLGEMCLELHSHKANKRAVLEDLERTLGLGRPKTEDIEKQAQELKVYRDKLNHHAKLMHSYLEPAKVTPYQILGELVRLRSAGVRPAKFALVDPIKWSVTDYRKKMDLLKDLVLHLHQIGNPLEHLWRGVELDTPPLPSDIDCLSHSLLGIIGRLERLIDAASRLSQLLRVQAPKTLLDCASIGRLAQRLVSAPAMDRSSIACKIWEENRDDIDALVKQGKILAASQEKLQGIVTDLAWSTDLAAARRAMAACGRSWFRIFNRQYRAAQAMLRGILVAQPPKPLKDRLELLDTLIRGQKARHALENNPRSQEIGQSAFGSMWRGVQSDWTALAAILDWEAECRKANLPAGFRQAMAALDDKKSLSVWLGQIIELCKPVQLEVQELFKRLKFNPLIGFGMSDWRGLPLAELKARLEGWQANTESITQWISYYIRWCKLDWEGMGDLARHLDKGLIAAKDALDQFQMAYYEALMREAFRRHPELAEFNGVSHEQVLAKFKALDRERLSLARQEVGLAHYSRLPANAGDKGEVAVVRREIKKQRRHLPLRNLLNQAGHAIQAIKPVFMMSPLSVAQYLEAGVLEFDLLLIDEASQVRPVDALGAIARAQQLVVVGDDRQLPPTRFFQKLLSEDGTEADEADDFRAGDLESILGLCAAQNMPQRMLQWHYRSRHHSLIAVSNYEFYNGRLYVVPSPMSGTTGLGLVFRYLPQGVFDRGRSATNRLEARVVADAVIDHARNFPDKTLGVGTFSVAQRDAILDELELRRRNQPGLEAFFSTDCEEPFFVKNLENIQGDERDVIFISVGYAKDESGYMAMNFGPLSNEGGERRLNVLITRARERCEVFSSITADDIDLNRAKSRGAQALKTFLTYAQSGHLDIPVSTGRPLDSEFEREVARALKAHGYEVHSQVGVAGFFVDLAVVDPQTPGRYLLGIECEGAAYHCSRSARDRHRLRQQVLEDRGWLIHRIWSCDWFHRPEEQLRKTLAAIQNAKVEWARRASGATVSRNKTPEPPQEGIDRHPQDGSPLGNPVAVETVSYVEASFEIPGYYAYKIHELPPGQLAEVVTRIVQIEGPIHQDEIARRVATLWGLRRTGGRIADAVEGALATAVYEGKLVQNGSFFSPTGQKEAPIRNRANVQSPSLRKPEYLPPQEIRRAVNAIVETHVGVSKDDVIVETARLFGFRSTSAQLRRIIEQEADHLCDTGLLEQRNGKLYLTDRR